MSAPESRARLSPTALAALHLAIAPAGAAQAVYGPILSAVAARFSVTVGTAGLVIGAHGAGSLVGVVVWSLFQRRLGLRRVTAAAVAALAAGAVLLATAGVWPLMLAGAFATGCGFGGLAVGTNVFVSNALAANSAPVLTSTAAAFGLGSIAAPAAVGWLGPEQHAVVLVGMAALAALAFPLLLLSEEPPPSPVAERGARRPSAAALLFTLAIGLYASLEVSIGGWEATHLEGIGYSPAAAARSTAAFWLAFTVGRMIATPVSARVSVVTLSLGAVVVTAGALALASAGVVVGALAVAAYALAGLAMAPVFPATFGWFARATRATSFSTALFFMSGSVGGALIPPAIGAAVDRWGPGIIPLCLLAVALLCGFALAATRRLVAPPAAQRAAPGAD